MQPSEGRKKGQARRLEIDSRCDHPEEVRRVLLLIDGGYIEYCVQCNQVIDLYESM